MAFAAVVAFPRPAMSENWEGVDETMQKIATEAGHPPSKPLIDTDRGDLLLFLFLTSGAVGGFIAGYAFRTLFPPKAGDCPSFPGTNPKLVGENGTVPLTKCTPSAGATP
ncbi:MAG: hypothetical protein ABSG68_26350 [Thermoguttaceae bacterium]|jgi:ABC-type cobalt transport system substrate-binding protein